MTLTPQRSAGGWVADTLAPARNQMNPKTYNRLSNALTLLLGIDPVVVMTDIAGATREEALDALEWSARALVEAALAAPGRRVKSRPDR